MTLAEIRDLPTTFRRSPSESGIHESVLRAYNCLMKVKEYAKSGADAKVILEIINDCMDAPHKTLDISKVF